MCADQTQPGPYLSVKIALGEAARPPFLSSVKDVLPADDVRRKFIAVLAAVAADVTLKRLAETMAAHVDGKHDMVQEKHAAVLATEGAHSSPLRVYDPKSLPRGGGGRCR